MDIMDVTGVRGADALVRLLRRAGDGFALSVGVCMLSGTKSWSCMLLVKRVHGVVT